MRILRPLRFAVAFLLLASAAHAQSAVWARYALISPTSTLSAGHTCYTDGVGIACDGTAPLASDLGLNDRITSGTTSVFAGYNGPVSVTIAGSNVANFGTGGLGITAINASGLIQSTGISDSAAISTTGTGYFGGKVGIGTTTPNTALEIANGWLRLTSVYGIQFGASSEQVYGNSSSHFLGFLTTSTERLRITSNGNVGVGNLSPAATLQVSGTFIVSQTGQNTTPSLYVGSNGRVGIGVSNPATALNILGGVYIQNRPGQDGNDVQGLLSADGTRRFAWYVASNYAYFQAENGASLNFGVTGDLTRNIVFWSNNETNVAMMVQNSSGKIGISTTTPKTSLDVSGTLRISNGGESCSSSTSGGIRYTSGNFEFCSGSSWQTLGVLAGASSDRITSGTSTVFVAQDGPVSFTVAGTNVANFGPGGLGITAINASGLITAAGVSTTGPISGTSGYFSNIGIGIAPSTVYKTLQDGGIMRIQNAGHLEIDSQNDQALQVINGSNTFFRVDTQAVGGYGAYFPTGNVGINTTAPAATLQVSGTFIVSQTGQNTTPSLYVDSTGYVGIGTTPSTTSFLSVQGGPVAFNVQNNPVALYLQRSNSQTSNLSIAYLGVGISWYAGMNLQGNYAIKKNNATINSNPDFTITSASLVGIGVPTPTTLLDVSGTLKISTGGESCSATTAGGIRYTSGNFEFCSGSSWQTLGVLAGASSDRITSGTSTVFVAQDGPVSFTVAGTNVANFGSGGLGITAINASGLITAAGISTTGPISGTDGYFSNSVGIGTTKSATNFTFSVSGTNGFYVSAARNQLKYNGSAYLDFYNTSSGIDTKFIRVGNISGFGWLVQGVNDAYTISKNLMVISATTGNVGIGTPTPAATLDVSGSFRVSGTVADAVCGTDSDLGIHRQSAGILQVCSAYP